MAGEGAATERAQGGSGAPTERTRLRRFPEQGSHERAALEAVRDAGFLCHLGVVVDGWPMVVPTTYGRAGDRLYLHGSVASRSVRRARGNPVCVTVTHLGGIVLARSVFNEAANDRAAMIYGEAEALTEPDDKRAALRAISEQVLPGQWEYARAPSDQELAQTSVVALGLAEASVKVRAGPPDDGDGPDGLLSLWAGELPARMVFGPARPAPGLDSSIALPPHVRDWLDHPTPPPGHDRLG